MTKEEVIKWLESLKREIGKAENRTLWHYAESIDMVIEAMSEPKAGEWIPVSEKPKDEKRTYLVQLDSGGMCSCRWTNANPFWTELTTDWHWNIFDIPQYCKVVAWMDLKPYRDDREEYELATEQMEHDAMYEPTYNSEDGSM